MSTNENLQSAFAGESQANRKYLAFAKKAEADGKPQIAKLFRAAAEAETIHAHGHLRALKGVKSTAENVQAAISGEGFEFKEMYPPMLAEAKKDSNTAAAKSFEYALEAEKVHFELYSKASDALKNGTDLPAGKFYVCTVCGNTVLGEAPGTCPICKVGKEKFVEVK